MEEVFKQERSWELRNGIKRDIETQLKRIRKRKRSSIRSLNIFLIKLRFEYKEKARFSPICGDAEEFLIYKQALFRGTLSRDRIILKGIKQSLKLINKNEGELEGKLIDLLDSISVQTDLDEKSDCDRDIMRDVAVKTDKLKVIDRFFLIVPEAFYNRPDIYVQPYYKAYCDNGYDIASIEQILLDVKYSPQNIK